MKFKLTWIGGKTEIVEGADIAAAFRGAGYGGGAIHALDSYETIHEEEPLTQELAASLMDHEGEERAGHEADCGLLV